MIFSVYLNIFSDKQKSSVFVLKQALMAAFVFKNSFNRKNQNNDDAGFFLSHTCVSNVS